MSDPYNLYQTQKRCLDHTEGTKSTPVFDQLMKNDAKSSKKLTDDLCKNLTTLLIDDEKCDMANIICGLGSTSACESNHARIINRNIHVKGLTFLTSIWPQFDLELILIWPLLGRNANQYPKWFLRSKNVPRFNNAKYWVWRFGPGTVTRNQPSEPEFADCEGHKANKKVAR